MSQIFNELRSSERDLLLKAPLLVGILIAGTDGILNTKQQKRLENTLYSTARKYGKEIESIFQRLIDNLNIYLIDFMHSYPRDEEERKQQIISNLTRINDILPKIDNSFALDFYSSLKEVAKSTSKSMGGYILLGTRNKSEKKYIDLPMIQEPGYPLNAEHSEKSRSES